MSPKPCLKEMDYINPRRGLGGALRVPLGWTRVLWMVFLPVPIALLSVKVAWVEVAARCPSLPRAVSTHQSRAGVG